MANPFDALKDAIRFAAAAETGGIKGDGVTTCWFCGQPPQFYSEAGREEFAITGQCEFCFDEGCTDPNDCCKECGKPQLWHEYYRTGACRTFKAKR